MKNLCERSWRLAALLALILSLLLCPGARAEPPVKHSTRSPQLDSGWWAAQAARASFWEDDTRNDKLSHVVLRLEHGRALLTLGLPPTTPYPQAVAELRALAAALGWTDAQLRTHAEPSSLYLVLESRRSVRTQGLTASSVSVDFEPVRATLRRLTPNPAVLCVQTVETEPYRVTPEPPARARSRRRGDTFLFYRLSDAPPGLMSVQYGLTFQSVLGFTTGWLLWLVFPLAPFLFCRRRLARREDLPEAERERIYRRQALGVKVVSVVGVWLTASFLLTNPFEYYGDWARSLVGGDILALCFWYAGIDALSKILHRRMAGEIPAPLSSWTPAMGGLLVAVCLTALSVMWQPPWTQEIPDWFRNLNHWANGGGLVLIGLWLLWTSRIGAWSPDQSVAPEMPDDAEGLRRTIEEIAMRLKAEQGAVPPALDIDGLPPDFHRWMLAERRALASLDFDQQAALFVASCLIVRDSSVSSRWWTGDMILSAFIVMAAGVAFCLIPKDAPVRVWGGVLAAMTLALLLSSAVSSFIRSSARGHPDLKVAQAMDDPPRYLEALLRVEQAAREHAERERQSGTSDVSGSEFYAERRRRLAKQLRLK